MDFRVEVNKLILLLPEGPIVIGVFKTTVHKMIGCQMAGWEM